jgi:hypothetical protein
VRVAFALVVVGVAGCNLVFESELGDVPDGGAGACRGPLTFTKPRVPILGQEKCERYGHSATRGLGMAVCDTVISEGVPDADMFMPSAFAIPGTVFPTLPRLAPEGTQMFVLGPSTLIEVYERQGNRWMFKGPTNVDGTLGFSAPTTGSMLGRRLIAQRMISGRPLFAEYAEAGAQWMETFSYERDDLEVTSMSDPNLSADGLHLVFIGGALDSGTPRCSSHRGPTSVKSSGLQRRSNSRSPTPSCRSCRQIADGST